MTEPQLNLVVLRSPDMDRAADFYRRLGLAFVKHRHGSGPEHYACEMGAAVFEVYPRQGEGDSTAGTRVGFRVAGVDVVVAELEAVGVQVVSRPGDSPWGRRAVVVDPDGHRVELAEAAASAA